MKIWRLTILWEGKLTASPTVGPRLSEAEMSAALNVPDKHPLFQAVLQFLGDFEEGIRLRIGADPDKPNLVCWAAAGADYIAQFRDRLLEQRRRAMAGLAAGTSAAPTSTKPNEAKRRLTASMRDASGRRPEEG